MLIAAPRFPITDGTVIVSLRATLIAWADGLTVQRLKPAGTDDDPLTRRMVWVRNDSGPQDLLRSFRRYGVNVAADDRVEAEQIALDSMAGLRSLRAGGITRTDQFSGPLEIEDSPAIVVDGKPLGHFYFTFRAAVRGINP